MIRIRTSLLEAFRRVVETDYGDEQEIIDTINRGQWVEGPSSWQMRAGTAWHAVLANAEGVSRKGAVTFHHKTKQYETTPMHFHYGDYHFSDGDVQLALMHVGPGITELTGRKVLTRWKGIPVELEGTADRVNGLVIRDAKTKFSQTDPRDYEASIQWRAYLTIHGAEQFIYDCCEFSEPKDGLCVLRNIVSFSFWRYDQMERDVVCLLERFIEWTAALGLTERLILPPTTEE